MPKATLPLHLPKPHVGRLLFVCTLGALLLTGCAQNAFHRSSTQLLHARDYLQLANETTGAEQADYLLSASKQFLQEDNRRMAGRTLHRIDPNTITPEQFNTLQIIRAQYFLKAGKPGIAVSRLNNLSPLATLSTEGAQERLTLLADAYHKMHDDKTSITVRDQLLTITPPEEQPTVLRSIWAQLNRLSMRKLQQTISTINNAQTRAWFTFAHIVKRRPLHAETFIRAMQDWVAHNPEHPANFFLNHDALNQPGNLHPNNITLLLPLTGPYKDAATAIKNGMLAAYFEQKKADPSAPTIVLRDTNTQTAATLYTEAVQNKSGFVIGPLTKTNVDNLLQTIQAAPDTPRLVLNTSTQTLGDNTYAFSLNPAQEARFVADHLSEVSRDKVGILYPNTPRGQAIATAFQTTLAAHEGTVLTSAEFTDRTHYADAVKNLLGINDSLQRIKALEKQIGSKVRYQLRRRNDLDAVFIVANPTEARILVPLLRYYYANDLPLYGSSSVFADNMKMDSDLNGLIFPYLPKQWSPAARHSKQLWPHDYARHKKLYAFGIDAYHIANTLPILRVLQNIPLPGATGLLSLDGHTIVREPTWVQIRHGKPVAY